MSTGNFKAIIVGAGPVGLTAAIVLARAGIDFILLESRAKLVVDAGASLVLQPTGLRILAQLGLLDAFFSVSSALSILKRCDHNGVDIGETDVPLRFLKNHGIASRVVSRYDLTKVLYDAIPPSAQAKMHPNKKVRSITTTPSTATVHCTDGTSYTGSIVIGADGAHSIVRSQMRTLALADSSTPSSQINDEHPFLATFRCLWIRYPTHADIRPGDAAETHGYDLATQSFAGEDTTVTGVYERLPQPTTERLRFVPEDEEEIVKRWGHLPITEQLSLQDVYDARVSSGMVSLEEGVLPNWSWDRLVLVGDAAHKFTPSTGAGCNQGMADCVVLANELVRILAASPEPRTEDIARAFGSYQEQRFEKTVAGCAQSGGTTAMATWSSWFERLLDLWVAGNPWFLTYRLNRLAAPGIAATPALEFIPDEGLPEGRFPWVRSQGSLMRSVEV
ncbi:hypothetical protein B0T16DRAFT_125877 [Cercophora newfieldiana]|uniref:FAD-binding domain-containing protein n=1 Tax=Cercophora newfieldiana TaxID=92897 RepID=A0AA40CU52_9PEZI|nr:hypothetical protein B0T16DRAFT_125877 [Cercophora newfieldiana]